MIGTHNELVTPAVTVEEEQYFAGSCIARHSHKTANLIYIVAGTHWSGHSRGGDLCAPGTVRFIPAGEPHENYFPVDSRCMEIQIGQPLLDLAAEHTRTFCSPGELKHPSTQALGTRLYEEFCRRDQISALEIEAATLQLLVCGEPESMPRRGSAPPWLLRIREMLHDQENRRMSLAELSRCAGRHPVQISRQFHRHFHCTIGQYLRRVQVARAQALLLRSGLELAEIALACGFSDQSHFTSAFRSLAGMPPRRFRNSSMKLVQRGQGDSGNRNKTEI